MALQCAHTSLHLALSTTAHARYSWGTLAELTSLSSLAIGLTGYGIYEFYTTFLVWPRELREPLRSAVKAEQAGKHDRSAHLFNECVATDPERLNLLAHFPRTHSARTARRS